jgi:hypothetical protein
MHKDIFGKYSGSKSNYYKWKNGQWRKRRSALTTKITARYRDGNCLIIDAKDESDVCVNCKDIRAVVTKHIGKHSYASSDIFLHRSLGGIIHLDITLDPCK